MTGHGVPLADPSLGLNDNPKDEDLQLLAGPGGLLGFFSLFGLSFSASNDPIGGVIQAGLVGQGRQVIELVTERFLALHDVAPILG